MPTYAYACSQCQHRFEVHQSFTDEALTECPECGGRLRKQFGSVGVVFKGSGFYRTDSRGSGTAKSSGETSGGTAGSSSGTASTPSSSGSAGSSAGSSSAGSSAGSGSSSPAA